MTKNQTIMKVIDLSHLLTNGMQVYPGTPPVILKSSASLKSEGFNELRIQITTHIGTHIDCPLHLFNNGFNTTADINKFYGRGVKIDCRDAGAEIQTSLLQKSESVIREADFLLLSTGWEIHWQNSGYFGRFPVLSSDAAVYLSRFSLKGIGIDAPGLDPVDSSELPVHKIFFGKEMILVENLANLQSLPEAGFMFTCFPLKIENGDGCPVRATAIL